MEKQWNKVFETHRPYKIEIAREILEEYGIECKEEKNVMEGKNDNIILLVHKEDVNIANNILIKYTIA